MKIYIDFEKQSITKIEDADLFVGDINSNTFIVLFSNVNEEFITDESSIDFYPTLTQLAPNGREAGPFLPDALEDGETIVYNEDNVNYLRYQFTMNQYYALMDGRSNFFVYINKEVNGGLTKKVYAKFNCVLNVSDEQYFISDPAYNPQVKAYIDSSFENMEKELDDYVEAKDTEIDGFMDDATRDLNELSGQVEATLDAANETISTAVESMTHPTYSDISDLPTTDVGLVVGSDGYIYSWDSTNSEYVSTGIVYQASQIADGSVTKTKLGSDVIDTLTSDLISILYLRNQLIDDMFGEVLANSTHGIYLLYTDGTAHPSSNYSASDYISVESNKEYRFITQSIPFDLQVCFYDHTKTFISGKLIPNARDVTFTNDVNYAKYIRFSYETKYENATFLTPNDDLTKEKLDDLLKNTNVDLSEGNNVNQTISDGTAYWGTNLTVETNSFIKGITLLNVDVSSLSNSGIVYFCYLNENSYTIFDKKDFTLSNTGNNNISFDTPVICKHSTIFIIIKLNGLRYANGGSSIGMSEFFLDSSEKYFTKGQTISSYALGVIVNTTISIIDKVNTLMSRNYITVKKSGGDYTSIATAVANAQEDDTIIVYPGVYENEIIEAATKKIHLIGIDRETCIIKNNTNTYLTPALEISKGSVSNLSFIQDKDLESVITTDFPYAVHIDYPYLTNQKLVFDNCYFYSKFTASVGVGTRANCELIFNNCYFETEHNVNSINKHIGALFIHPSLTPNSDNQNVIINNCSLVSKLGSALHFETLNVSNTNTYVTLFKNFLYSKENGTTNVITVDGTYDNVHITDKSFGNNVNV